MLTGTDNTELKRELGVFQAMMLGLGSILGTGVFVSIGLGADVAGASVVLAVVLAAGLATCNGLSSAQLAANHPVSGGTYEYGYRWLSPRLGFTAGWMFMCAKSASAATAALSISAYVLQQFSLSDMLVLPAALIIILIVTCLTLSGIKRSSRVNTIIVSITIISLLCFIGAAFKVTNIVGSSHFDELFTSVSEDTFSFFECIALMFVAYTGYGRIATLGEEVKDPGRNIPRAIITTLVVSMLLYVLVALSAVGIVGASHYGSLAVNDFAPLQRIASKFGSPLLAGIVSIGAVTAMLGVLLNLILGLSRVLLAMGRRSDVPTRLGNVTEGTGVPVPATICVGIIIAAIVLVGDIKTTWTFSAFTVLIYYALTNLCAIRLDNELRLYPVWISYCGFAGCVFLTLWIAWPVWLAGTSLLITGLIWRAIALKLKA